MNHNIKVKKPWNTSLLLITVLTLLALLGSSMGSVAYAQDEQPEWPVEEIAVAQAADAFVDFGWQYDRPHDPPLFTDLTSRYLRFDSNNNPHVAFGGDHLYYAYRDGSGWHTEIVDNSLSVGRYASLALDSSNRPHISYYDALNGNLKYAFKNQGQWIIRVMDTGSAAVAALAAETGQSLEGIDPVEMFSRPNPELDLGPVAAFIDPSLEMGEAEALAAGTDAEFSPLAVNVPLETQVFGVGLYTSIAIDSDGNVGISYYDAVNGDLKYTFWENGAWHIQVADRGGSRNFDVGTFTSLAFDSEDRPQIVYMNESQDNLRYASYRGPNWEVTTVDSTTMVGAYNSLAFDRQNNRPYISYYDFGNHDLKYATRTGDGWITITLDEAGDVGAYSSITLDRNRRPRITYFHLDTLTMKYASYNGSEWSIDPITQTRPGGKFTSVAFDNNFNLGIVFFDMGREALRFLRPSGSNWVTEDIALMSRVGVRSSMGIGPDGVPHIAYLNDTTDSLLYATTTSGSWQLRDLFGPGKGQYFSLKVDSNGTPHIAFLDQSTGDLNYAYLSGSNWVTEIIDDSGSVSRPVGRFVDLALDRLDSPYVAYYDSLNGDLKYGLRTGGSWNTYTVDSVDNVGELPSIVISDSFIPHIAYYDVARNDLKYTYWDPTGNTWRFQVIDPDGGIYPSIMLSPEGLVRIAYYLPDRNPNDNTSKDDLMWAVQAGDGWTRYILDSAGEVGLYPSGVIDPDGDVHITYYDKTNGDLKYMHWDPSGWTRYTVDRYGDVGAYPSLALDPNGVPNISYFDATHGDLKVARGVTLDKTLFLPMVTR